MLTSHERSPGPIDQAQVQQRCFVRRCKFSGPQDACDEKWTDNLLALDECRERQSVPEAGTSRQLAPDQGVHLPIRTRQERDNSTWCWETSSRLSHAGRSSNSWRDCPARLAEFSKFRRELAGLRPCPLVLLSGGAIPNPLLLKALRRVKVRSTDFWGDSLHRATAPSRRDFESSDQFLNTSRRLDQLTNNQLIYHLQSLLVGAAYRTGALSDW
jgi:hypothetical protein